MSDFLTNLAARTLAPPSLRPRTRSRFEPAQAAGEPVTASAGRAVAAGAPRMVSDTVSRKSAAREVINVERLAASSEPAVVHNDFVEAPRDDRPQPSAPPPARKTASVAHPPSPTPLPRAPRAAGEAPIPVRVTTIETPATHELRTETIVETRETIVRETAQPSTPRAPLAVRRPLHRNDEQPPNIDAQPAVTAAVPRAPRIAAARPPLAAPPPSEPVVHVSIGRVEVRAVAPQPAAKPARAPRRAMTIDDYAARRNAKGRP